MRGSERNFLPEGERRKLPQSRFSCLSTSVDDTFFFHAAMSSPPAQHWQRASMVPGG